ncbi:unnamed protein product, partial [Protopolystoma xenopodis]
MSDFDLHSRPFFHFIFYSQLAEYEELEKSLREALSRVSQRERQLAAGEIELVRLRNETMQEIDSKRRELNAVGQRTAREAEQRIRLEREQRDYWKNMADEWHQKCIQLEKEPPKRGPVRSSSASRGLSTGSPVDATCPDENQKSVITTNNESNPSTVQLQVELARLSGQLVACEERVANTEHRLAEANSGRLRYRRLWMRA